MNMEKLNEIDRLKLKPKKIFGDSIHGTIKLNALEVAIVDTKAFQRLRKIRQLGTANLVYVTANHTRFEHSLGVLHMASVIIESIRGNAHNRLEQREITLRQEQITRLLALLHDIGHMPYGHTLEDEFNIFLSHDHPRNDRWEYFLGVESEIGKLIIDGKEGEFLGWGEEFHKDFIKLISCDKEFPEELSGYAFCYDIISNTVCADLLDYLLRDCFNTGLNLSSSMRFLEFMFIAKFKAKKRIVIRLNKSREDLRKDNISELIQLLRNRYFLGERVYYHRVKIITGTMIAAAVKRAINGNFVSIVNRDTQTSIQITDDHTHELRYSKMTNLHLMGDDEIVEYLLNIKNNYKKGDKRLMNGIHYLASSFKHRNLYKQLTSYSLSKLELHTEIFEDLKTEDLKNHSNSEIRHLTEYFLSESGESRVQLEDQFCDLVSLRPGSYLIYCPGFKMSVKLAQVLVYGPKSVDPTELMKFKNDDEPTIAQEIDVLVNKHKNLWRLRIMVSPDFPNDLKEFALVYSNYIVNPFNEDYKKEYFKALVELYLSKLSIDKRELNGAFNELVEELSTSNSEFMIKKTSQIEKEIKRILEKIRRADNELFN